MSKHRVARLVLGLAIASVSFASHVQSASPVVALAAGITEAKCKAGGGTVGGDGGGGKVCIGGVYDGFQIK